MARLDAANAGRPQAGQRPAQGVAGRPAHVGDDRTFRAGRLPEAAQLAARAQHIRRWTVPRNGYPMTREDYHAWRTGLYTFHANIAGELMRQAGYDDAMIERVKKRSGQARHQNQPGLAAAGGGQAGVRRSEMPGGDPSHLPHLGRDVESRPGFCPVRQNHPAGTPAAGDQQGNPPASPGPTPPRPSPNPPSPAG
ncbi:MAG: DUF4202 family protein [Hyphomicrobiaceae bacterium]